MTDRLLDLLQDLAMTVEAFLQGLTDPARLAQMAVLALLAALALAIRRASVPRVSDWIRQRAGWPRARLRLIVVLRDRIGIGSFAALAWLAAGLFRALRPGEGAILASAASLATGWLAVALASRLIASPSLRGLVKWVAWIWVTLYLTGLLDEAAQALDSAAISLGGARLSLLDLLKAVAVTALLLAGARFLSAVAQTRIRGREDISPSMQVLTLKGLQVSLYAAAFFLGLRAVGFDLTGLAVLSGAIGVGIGFGLQKVVSNLISGVIILLDKSIKPGDVITIGETFGWITELGARYVSISTRDGKDYLIPNEDLITGQVVNWSHTSDLVRLDIFFGCSYQDDPHLVRRVAIEAAAGVKRVEAKTPPVCHITGFGDSSVDYILRFWIHDPSQGLTNVRGNVYLALWDAFRAHGITIPFPQREVRILPAAPPAGGLRPAGDAPARSDSPAR
ncbi:mechanosensitive ion channel family protein [Frigidibacter oleivorans]|uniref:mechanosensitive ion channel family protein n=1 Tax=Frigidibacter oleivorans TaxID=2487129 RepID=UPI000F8D1B53|nr:mechanosensitive ion channel domain-containing protein [Frigidibacter oleivorans]